MGRLLDRFDQPVDTVHDPRGQSAWERLEARVIFAVRLGPFMAFAR
jgi:hypothetical protein